MLDILFHDEHMVAVHKPPGMLVHRSLIDKRETVFVMQSLRDQIGQHVFPVHRLDRPTSGVLLFALNPQIARALSEQFSAQTVDKRYLAIVRGYAPEQGSIDHPLKEKLDKIADKMADQDKPAQSALTHFRTMGKVELNHPVGRYATARYSVVSLKPVTGRKHQLRRHMGHISHPILGDTTHGDGKHNHFARQTFGFQGLALTCTHMSLTHPIEQTALNLRTHLDDRIEKLLGQWGWQRAQLRQLTESVIGIKHT